MHLLVNLTTSIQVTYVDGISLTHGSPRQHIWTFAAARDERAIDNHASKCPCIINTEADLMNRPPEFVGSDYFCDTSSENGAITNGLFLRDDPLWDGAGCGPRSTCCIFNNPPWFYKQLPQPITDDIEMRVCRDEDARYEDIGIGMITIYIHS